MQQITKTHVAEKFRSDAVSDTTDDFRPIICRIDVNAERALSKRSVHDLDNGICNFGDIRTGNRSTCEALHDFLIQFRCRPGRILGNAAAIAGFPGVREMISAGCERAGNNDRGFDVPPR